MTRYLELIAEYDLQSKQEQEYWDTLGLALKEIYQGFFSYLELPAKTVRLLSGEEKYLSLFNVERIGRKLTFTLSLLLGDPKVMIPPSKFVFRGDICFDGETFHISSHGIEGAAAFARDDGFDRFYPMLIDEAKRQLAYRPEK
ncbi:hypothetical protein [Pseudomonas viridiflava]|uniref:hypothetical protein n=1 Tax=Pseudomonas viridiflava TaxID=33069 RepID=UPI000F01C221|nr:hypothetical protein [Pseudomonas viridiflava]